MIGEKHVHKIGAFVMLVHVSGMIGVMTSFKDFFVSLTAMNLIFTFLLMVWYHEKKSSHFWSYVGIITLSGFLLEMIGVNTGFPFGSYYYGFPFGPQILGTPPTIGLNWFVLTYGVSYLLSGLKAQKWIKAILTGAGVTFLDVLIEPVAIYLDYWNWAALHVPIQNYITWFVAISIFSYFIYNQEEKSDKWVNPIVKWVISAQFIYFLVLCWFVL